MQLVVRQNNNTNQTKAATSALLNRLKLFFGQGSNGKQPAAFSGVPRGLRFDHRSSPLYNNLYSKLHGSTDWPMPKPFFRGNTATYRYSYVRGVARASQTMAASTSMAVAVDPYNRLGPLYYSYTGSASTWYLATVSGSHTDIFDDRDATGAATPTVASWAHTSPNTIFESSGVNKSGQFVNVPTSDEFPSMAQAISIRTKIHIVCPIDGVARVFVASPADNPDVIGRRMRPMTIDTTLQGGGGAAVQDRDFFTHERMINNSTALNHQTFHTQLGKVYTVGPGKSTTIVITGEPDVGWARCGSLDLVDSAVGTQTCARWGMKPRFNASGLVTYGGAYIYSDGSGPISVVMETEVVLAIVADLDSPNSVRSTLTNMLIKDMPTTSFHMPHDADPASIPSYEYIIDGAGAHRRALVQAGVHSAIADHAHDSRSSISSFGQTPGRSGIGERALQALGSVISKGADRLLTGLTDAAVAALAA